MNHNQDDRLLAHTLELARNGTGRVEPNPIVGAVIVQAGEVVATGYHHYYGGLHAERAAIENARVGAKTTATAGATSGATTAPTTSANTGGKPLAAAHEAPLRGATLYCNLEPCSHRCPEKHQPPCTEAIIAAGIARVVVGQLDPNPAVRGNGVRALRRAGITVDLAEDPAPFIRGNEVFNTTMALNRPFVHLKAAISLDGRIATASGDSRWITDDDARNAAHRLRARRDAVLVGRGTVEQDDPQLTARLDGVMAQPRAVVLDSFASISLKSRLLRERPEALILCVSAEAPEDRVEELRAAGVRVLSCSMEGERLNMAEVLNALYRDGIRSILVEGGSRVISGFFRTGLYDRFTLYIAPMVLGAGRDLLEDLEIKRVLEAIQFESVRWETIRDQQCFDGYRRGWLADIAGVIPLDIGAGVPEEGTGLPGSVAPKGATGAVGSPDTGGG